MSYCRWSCDSWKSDVYCYFDGTHYVTHVARQRVTSPIPPVPDLNTDVVDDEATMARWMAAHSAQQDALEHATRTPIGGPHDGQAFYAATLGEFRALLLRLRGLDYHIPQYALDRIDAEQADVDLAGAIGINTLEAP